jgi:hypothetical protein
MSKGHEMQFNSSFMQESEVSEGWVATGGVFMRLDFDATTDGAFWMQMFLVVWSTLGQIGGMSHPVEEMLRESMLRHELRGSNESGHPVYRVIGPSPLRVMRGSSGVTPGSILLKIVPLSMMF